MITAREKGMMQLLISGQLLVVTLLFWVVFGVQFYAFYDETPPIRSYLFYCLSICAALIAEALNRPSQLRLSPGMVRRLAYPVTVRQILWISGALLILLVAGKDSGVSRVFISVFLSCAFLLLFLSNRYVVKWSVLFGARHLKDWGLRTILIGPHEWCDSIRGEMNFQNALIEFVHEEHVEDGGNLLELCNTVASKEVDLLVMPARHLDQRVLAGMMNLGDKLGFRCWFPLELTRLHQRHFHLVHAGQLDMLTPPEEPLENLSNRFLKRAFDVVFAALMVLFVLPFLCIFVKILHWRYSPGPLFFVQNRTGINGKLFKCYKFRSLNVANGEESKQVTSGDDRIYKGGRFIRKTSIDEIPQFLNVLMGDMSVVGPRPHMKQHDDEFAEIFERYGNRRHVKPGVTGLAQMKGFRGEVNARKDLRNRGRLDNFYVTHWSMFFDVIIIVGTLWSVVRPPKTAY